MTSRGPREVPRPLAVLTGPPAAEVLSSCCGGLTLLGALALAPSIVAAAAPWAGLTSWLVQGGWVIYALACVAVLVVARRWALPRQGKAEVLADRVVVRKDDVD